MNKAVALSRELYANALQRQKEVASSAVVLTCGAALIFAGQALPF